MADLYETEKIEERVILVAVAVNDAEETAESLDELEELAKTAGAITVAKVIQNREKIHPGTYIGKGKMEEVRELVDQLQADTVVCDDELSPAQLKNLEGVLQTKVIDRTVMILDIFASRAITKEGKIQVELAQLKYRSSRLIGLRSSLSRLGGGIGTKGPGEKKLEMDRRLIKDRISILNSELDDVKSSREVARRQRSKNLVPLVAIVGYTNAGKSTLLNTLTNANVLEEDKLFATLDSTTRSFTLENGQQVLFTDTVGFIRKLPHHLIEAFRSTLEEAKYADIVLHVVDSANPAAAKQMHIVYETLKGLGIQDKPIITAFNKIDKLEDTIELEDRTSDRSVRISAKTRVGLEELLSVIEEKMNDRMELVEKIIPYDQAGKIQAIRKYGQLMEEKYQEDGIYIKALVPKEVNLSNE